ncbi:hypothetical protein [Noviherbaspirillum sp.]|uniref:hypothetical protein n=1 Tax=Noviherbaspirillum sp. TaxID=1926288 RepID=UPI002D318F33|nr:hypothetical protein [Noviherbaspirillum sp.]HZW22282.1 hypothetical protein [Noviherbaspirillum sp.]
MTDPGTIFQRTHTGREEIHKKSHGLTQSERLVLIMVDGVSSYQQIRAKLPVLTDERFGRALQKLQLKELVLEIFMPVEGQAPDELERTVIDRFLQQDPMDPVTIILRDPEEELELLAQSKSVSAPAPMPAPEMKAEDFPTLVVPAPAPGGVPNAEPAIDALHAELADSLAAELRAKRARRPPVQRPEPVLIPDPVTAELSPFLAVHWGYWLIVSGLSFILGFVLARITS